jgi:hypothetical protein
MNLQRRFFLGGILALPAAPAIVRAESLMKIWVPPEHSVETVTWIQYTPVDPRHRAKLLRHAMNYGMGVGEFCRFIT